ncbi:DUF4238 domain-containing protein [Pseudomonas sp. SG20056]|uniref:DUF4238 domain-containing protein n=1 Tax=Pseudomonas sp. SG20056 TaxID=3074146 RepID=UPI00287FD791|nr:DUF4238 domain-containing protein [Pseudomonas sp. SG20056]WNF48444.1 DUF4238 domain-containing protein [Pseudomonas sp. SG20056]
MNKKTKKQHFVSQFYLNRWANEDGMISARGEKGSFTTTSLNIAHMNHMYRVEGIEDAERKILLKGAEKTAEPMKGLLKSLIEACHKFKVLSRMEMSEADAHKLEVFKQNIIEEFYGVFESQVQEAYTIVLEDKYEEFNINHYQDILRFVILQLSRTTKTKEKSKELLEPLLLEKGISFRDFDTLYSAIISEQITLSLIEKLYQIEVIENNTIINFITSDNPVKNMLAIEEKHVEIYWPISPRKAIMIKRTNFTPDEASSIKQGILHHDRKAEHIIRVKALLDEDEVSKLNLMVWDNKQLHTFYKLEQDMQFLGV